MSDNNYKVTINDLLSILQSLIGHREIKHFNNTPVEITTGDVVLYNNSNRLLMYNVINSGTLNDINDNNLLQLIDLKNIDTSSFINNNVLTEYVTKSELTNKNYIDDTTLTNKGYITESSIGNPVISSRFDSDSKKIIFTKKNNLTEELDLTIFDKGNLFASVEFNEQSNKLIFANEDRSNITEISLRSFVDNIVTQDATDTTSGKVTLNKIKELVGEGISAHITNHLNTQLNLKVDKTSLNNYVTTANAERTYAKKSDLNSRLTQSSADSRYVLKTQAQSVAEATDTRNGIISKNTIKSIIDDKINTFKRTLLGPTVSSITTLVNKISGSGDTTEKVVTTDDIFILFKSLLGNRNIKVFTGSSLTVTTSDVVLHKVNDTTVNLYNVEKNGNITSIDSPLLTKITLNNKDSYKEGQPYTDTVWEYKGYNTIITDITGWKKILFVGTNFTYTVSIDELRRQNKLSRDRPSRFHPGINVNPNDRNMLAWIFEDKANGNQTNAHMYISRI